LTLIEDAKAVKADAVKFQWTSNAAAMALRRGSAKRDGYDAIYRQQLQWPHEWHEELALHCEAADLDYLCTVYLKEDIGVVAPHVKKFKVSSFEAQDFDFFLAHSEWASPSQPVLISTGMCSTFDINRLRLHCLTAQGLVNSVKLLHCVSAYPTPFNELNLSVLRGPKTTDGSLVGFSDHSDPTLTHTGALAVAAGAEIVEAHLRNDDTNPDNPDYDHAMTTAQFLSYVAQIRMVEVALGSGFKGRQPCEEPMIKYRVQS
jgi:N,N'-diacetyllegionaminate synthase